MYSGKYLRINATSDLQDFNSVLLVCLKNKKNVKKVILLCEF